MSRSDAPGGEARPDRLQVADYPLAEKRPELIAGRRGKSLSELTLEALLAGEVVMEDLRITPDAQVKQAEIAAAAGRPTLGRNLERAAELVEVPQDLVMAVYELLSPGRAKAKEELLAAATRLRAEHGAERVATFIEEAAEVYERRGLFAKRF